MRRAISWIAAAAALAGCQVEVDGNENGPASNAEAAAEEEAEAEGGTVSAPAENALQPVDDRGQAPGGAPDGTDGRRDAGEDAMRWSFSRTAPGPKLIYGEPQTDNVRLMLRCPETGEVLLSFIRPAEVAEERPDTLAIISGGARRSLTIETEPGQLGTSVEAEAPLSAAPLQRFQGGSDLEVRWGSESIRVPGGRGGPIDQFYEACG